MINQDFFSWPAMQPQNTPSFTGTTQQIFSESVQFIFQNDLERAPTTSEISQYSSVIQNNFIGYTSSGSAIFDYHPAMQDVANLQETTDKIQSLFEKNLGDTASSSLISSAESDLGEGVSFSSIRAAVIGSNAEQNVLNSIYQSVLGRPIETAGLSANEQALADGSSLQDIRSKTAYSQEAQNDLNTIYQSVLGRPIENAALTGNEQALANGSSLQTIRLTTAYSQEAQNDLGAIYQSVLGRPIETAGLSANEQALADGSSLQDIRSKTAYSQEAQNDLGTIYQSVLGRPIENAGLSANEQALADGSSLQDIRSKTAYSQEAQNDLNTIYEQALGRAIDNAGLIANEQILASIDGNQNQIRHNIVYSNEEVGNISNIYLSSFHEGAESADIAGVQTYLNEGHSLAEVRSDLSSPTEHSDSDVTVYRVEAENINQRLYINDSGYVSIPNIQTRLYLNFGDEARAYEYLFQKLEQSSDFELKSFEVTQTFFSDVVSNAKPQEEGKDYPNDPQQGDSTRTNWSFGLPTNWITMLTSAIYQGSGRIVASFY